MLCNAPNPVCPSHLCFFMCNQVVDSSCLFVTWKQKVPQCIKSLRAICAAKSLRGACKAATLMLLLWSERQTYLNRPQVSFILPWRATGSLAATDPTHEWINHTNSTGRRNKRYLQTQISALSLGYRQKRNRELIHERGLYVIKCFWPGVFSVISSGKRNLYNSVIVSHVCTLEM